MWIIFIIALIIICLLLFLLLKTSERNLNEDHRDFLSISNKSNYSTVNNIYQILDENSNMRNNKEWYKWIILLKRMETNEPCIHY